MANINIAYDIHQINSLKLQFLSIALYLYTMILVTGGTGLVGSHLLLKLTETEREVRAIFRSQERVDRVERFFAFAKADSRFSRITWLQANLTDISALAIAFTGVTHVYHCAAFISFDPYDFDKLIKTNVEGTANVVNLCLSQEVTKLCYLSSIAALGKLPNNPVNEENHWDPNEDNSVYAISKYGAETEVWRGSQEGLDVIIFNPGVILGEGPINEGSGKLFARIMKGSSFYPTGLTAFVDVQDVVTVLIEGMASPKKNERYVLIEGNHSFKEILGLIAQLFSKKPPYKKLSQKKLKALLILDKIRGFFVGKRKLTRAVVSSISESQSYTNQKVRDHFEFTPIAIEDTIHRVAQYHKQLLD